MDASLKAKWLADLRSGKFPQGNGALLRNGCYCVLGVLCMSSGVGISSDGHEPLGANVRDDPYRVFDDLLGVTDTTDKLWRMNDRGMSFPEIADYIESHIPSSSEPSHG